MRRIIFNTLLILTLQALMPITPVAGLGWSPLYAQNARDLIRLGNREYRAERYEKAEVYYRKSIAKTPSFEAYYNLGNTLVMQQKDSTAFDCYVKADSLGTTDPLRRARCFHNMGNIWYVQGLAAVKTQQGNPAQAFQAAVNYFKSSLRCNPDDNETRYNLALAQYMLKKHQNDSYGGGGSDDKDKDKDQQKQDQKQEQQQQKEQEQKQQPPKKDEMSDQAAEQLLNSAQQDEKDVQRKVQQNPRKRHSLEKDW